MFIFGTRVGDHVYAAVIYTGSNNNVIIQQLADSSNVPVTQDQNNKCINIQFGNHYAAGTIISASPIASITAYN